MLEEHRENMVLCQEIRLFTPLLKGILIFPPFEKGGRGDFETKGISW